MKPLVRGPRHRDGAVSYNEYRGVRFNVEVEDPREQHSSRYRRRHPSKQYKHMKPWEK